MTVPTVQGAAHAVDRNSEVEISLIGGEDSLKKQVHFFLAQPLRHDESQPRGGIVKLLNSENRTRQVRTRERLPSVQALPARLRFLGLELKQLGEKIRVAGAPIKIIPALCANIE